MIRSSVSLVENFHICDILFSIPVIHPYLHIYSVALFLDIKIKIADDIIFEKLWKIQKLEYF